MTQDAQREMRLVDQCISAGLNVMVKVCENCLRTGGCMHSMVFKTEGTQRRQTGYMTSESHRDKPEDGLCKMTA